MYKLLVYEKGSFFLPHRDGEKLDPPLKEGETTTFRIRFRNTNLWLKKLDPSFTYVQRGSWTPFIDLLKHGVPMEMTLTLPARYTPLSFGEKTGQFSGNLMYGRWSYQTGSCRQSDL